MRKCFVAIATLIMAAGLVLTGCPNPSGGGGDPDTVTVFSLNGLITAPVRGATPVTGSIDTAQYAGTIVWQTADGAAHSGVFAPSTVYKVVVTLTAKSGYTFTGVGANSFTYTGATVANAANSGTVTITFPATAGEGELTVVSALSLDSLVTAPVRGATPVTGSIDTAQYTGTIAWQTNDGTAYTSDFAPSTVYKVVVTLTAKTGYTFTGVEADRFTYTGAATVTNAADSGVITITFQATAAPGADTTVTTRLLDGKVTAPVRGETPNTTAINDTQYAGTIVWQTADGAAHSGAFAASTVYKAVVTLTAKTGYTFTGVGANGFTYTGATTVTSAANSGTVTITFPATAAGDGPTVVNALSLDGKVTAPVTGVNPDTTAINETQYTGTVAWQTSGGAAHSGAFAADTVYKAVVTLTAKTGYTFTGLAANGFTYTGATTITNTVNSGTVTITFPATGGFGGPLDVQFSYIDPVTNREVYFSATTGNLVMASKGNVSGATSVTITAGYSDWGNYTYRWLVDGVEVDDQTTRSFSPRAANYDVGTHWVTVIATRNGVSYSRDLFIVVVD